MLTFKEQLKLDNEKSKFKVKCECGHTILIPPKIDRTICSWCKHYVYKDKLTKFKYEIQRRLKK